MVRSKTIPPAPAWADGELSHPRGPHEHPEKAEKVRRMFGSIAATYDLNNRLHSFGFDCAWRRAAARAAEVQPGETVLDAACGTGDLTQVFAAGPAGRVIGLDFTPEMLARARAKQRKLADGVQSKITYVEGDALALPCDDASIDVVSIAFGIRNVGDLDGAIREFFRVLRPGGRLVILEFDRPRGRLLRWANDLYCGRIMPITATLLSRDRTGAYRYLPRSVESFVDAEALSERLLAAGFTHATSRRLAPGICSVIRAAKM